MRTAPVLPQLLLLLACTAISQSLLGDSTIPSNDTQLLANGTILLGSNTVLVSNDTIVDGNRTIVIGEDVVTELDGEGEPIVRKKRTFGDIVFRGLADVLGYSVQPKPTVFPPPLAPVPGIDAPLQAGAAPATPAPAPAPCGAPRAAAPPPCRAQRPPAPPPPKPRAPAPPPCPRPRAAPPPKPRPPPPPPPPPPPCARPRANPTTPAPCGPAPAPKSDNVDVVSSNLQLNFNFNRNRATPAPAQLAFDQEEVAPIPIEPRPARLPAPQQVTNPKSIFVDAFVVRNGVTQRVTTIDGAQYDPQQFTGDDDYIAYDDESESQQADDDYYEDVQESRDKAVRDAVGRFWEKKKNAKSEPSHYKSVHFGDRNLANVLKRRSDKSQSLQRVRAHPNRIPIPIPTEADDDFEVTTTTEDPRKPLRPRVLPPTENNPNQIDTVTVRVPPIYKEKHPKKLHRGHQKPDRDEEEIDERPNSYENNADESDSEGENSSPAEQSQPRKRKIRKQRRKVRSAKTKNEKSEKVTEDDIYGVEDIFDSIYPPSEEEKQFLSQLRIPEPTKDADLARIEEEPNFFLDDHERLREDPERTNEREKLDNIGRTDDSGRSDERERLTSDPERTDEKQRADSSERTDVLSPHATVRETGYQNNYVRARNVVVDDPHPKPALKRG